MRKQKSVLEQPAAPMDAPLPDGPLKSLFEKTAPKATEFNVTLYGETFRFRAILGSVLLKRVRASAREAGERAVKNPTLPLARSSSEVIGQAAQMAALSLKPKLSLMHLLTFAEGSPLVFEEFVAKFNQEHRRISSREYVESLEEKKVESPETPSGETSLQ